MEKMTEDLYKEMLVTLKELNNYRYKAKDSIKATYWDGEIAKVKSLIKQYENETNTVDVPVDSLDGDSCTDVVQE